MASEVSSSEPTTSIGGGPGQRLAAARESKHLSPDQVAAELRLDTRIIEALERDDYDALPTAVFVRGYVRRYAALLGIDASDLLATSKPLEHVDIQARPGTDRTRKRLYYRPQIPWRAAGTLVLAGIVVAILFTWGPDLVNRLREKFRAQDDEATRRLVLPGQDQAPAAIPPVQEVPAPVAPVIEEAPAPEQSAVPAELPLDEISVSTVEPVIEEQSKQILSSTVRIELVFQEDSWVEMNAADGTRLLYGLLKKGQRRQIEGQAPVSILLGNSKAVDIQVDGIAMDISRYNKRKVSRFQIDKNR